MGRVPNISLTHTQITLLTHQHENPALRGITFANALLDGFTSVNRLYKSPLHTESSSCYLGFIPPLSELLCIELQCLSLNALKLGFALITRVCSYVAICRYNEQIAHLDFALLTS